MKSYKENGTYVLEADAGKILYNPKEEIYSEKIYSSRSVKMTDYLEVPKSNMISAKSTEELLLDFRAEIEASILIVRGTKNLTSTSVSYAYDAETHTITETFS